jgi:hypothetical protein
LLVRSHSGDNGAAPVRQFHREPAHTPGGSGDQHTFPVQVPADAEETEGGHPGYGQGRTLLKRHLGSELGEIRGWDRHTLGPPRLLRPGDDPGPRGRARSVVGHPDHGAGHILSRSPAMRARRQQTQLTPVDRHGRNLDHGFVAGRLRLIDLGHVHGEASVASVDQRSHRRRR